MQAPRRRRGPAALGPAAMVAGGIGLTLLGQAARRRSAAAHQAELAQVAKDYESLIAHVREAIVRLDARGCLTLVNPGWTRLTGHGAEESIGRPLTAFLEQATTVTSVGGHGRDEPTEVRLRSRPGEPARWAELALRASPDGGWVATLVDVSARVAARDELTTQALQDSLTGLGNRMSLLAHLERALATSGRSMANVGLIFLDLDRFKVVNDSLGHDVGDRLLREVALRLKAGLRAGDVACRLGGDEFVVLCEGLPTGAEAAIVQLDDVAHRVLRLLHEPMVLGGREIAVSASAGIALADPDQRPTALLADADAAMYHAKDQGRGRVAVFDARLRAKLEDRLAVEHALHRVLERDELEVWMQPVHALDSGEVIAFEALVRWRHPSRGLLAPDAFLSVAEDTGEIATMGAWILREACARAARWPMGADGPLRLAVNVSPVQLLRGDLPEVVVEALTASGLEPSRLELEITESVYLEADDAVTGQLLRLADMGVSIAMDDFGTGYSSLASLRELPITVIKLDRTFVSGLGRRTLDEAIVRSTVQMTTAMGLAVVAEGIETPDQHAHLRDLGCHRGQGYLFSPPVGPGDELALIHRQRAWPVAG